MQEILLYILGILIVVIGLGISIALHEIGHLLPAKLFGVKVTQYMIGFGKTLFSWKRGETEYGVKALPLGGYIAMTGMYPPRRPGEEVRDSTTGFLNSVAEEGTKLEDLAKKKREQHSADSEQNAAKEPEQATGLAGIIQDARDASAETVQQGEEHRAFYLLSPWKKIIVMAGGPLMNLLLAGVFYVILVCGFGVPQLSTTLASVNECVLPATSSQQQCEPGDEQSPGSAAGLLPGDEILAIDGIPLDSWVTFRDTIAASPDQALTLTVARDGADVEVTLVPKLNERIVTDADGVVVTDEGGNPLTERVGMVGVTPQSELVRQPITAVPEQLGNNIALVGNMILNLPERMGDVWQAAFGSEARDANGPIGVVGVGRVAGEIASMDSVEVAAKAQVMIGLLASLNVALFVFNLLPLMPLDGGHIAGALYEWLKRGIARVRGKPVADVHVDTAKMVPITLVVVVLMGAMTLLLLYADIVKPVNLFG